MHKVNICSHMCLSLFLILPFASAVPIYLSITTWSSMMLTACTPTLLKQNGRFVPEFHLPVHVCYSDKIAFLWNMFMFTCDAGKLFSLQPSTSGLALFSIFQTPGGVGLSDRECLPVGLPALLWCITNYYIVWPTSSAYGHICLLFFHFIFSDKWNHLL